MSIRDTRAASPIQLPGAPESARDKMDFRPRPIRGETDPKAASAPAPAASEQTANGEAETPPEQPLAASEHPTTHVDPEPAPETLDVPVEKAPEPEPPAEPASTKSESEKPAAKRPVTKQSAAKRPTTRPKRAPGNLLED